MFTAAWENPPKAFNPLYRPYAKAVQSSVVAELEVEGWYATKTQEERATEIRRRYIIEMAKREPSFQEQGGITNPEIFHPIAQEFRNAT